MKLRTQIIMKKDEKGIVLILALILMTLIFLLTLSAFEMVTVNTQIADNHIRDLEALYIAEAGIDHEIYKLRTGEAYDVYSCGPGNYEILSVVSIGSTKYRIRSKGTVYGSERIIEAEIRLFGASVPYTVLITSWKEI